MTNIWVSTDEADGRWWCRNFTSRLKESVVHTLARVPRSTVDLTTASPDTACGQDVGIASIDLLACDT